MQKQQKTKAPLTGAFYARSQYLKKGRNYVRIKRINRSSMYVHLRTMGDNPRRFQDHPLKTVGGVVFTRNCYICISKYFKKGHNYVRKGRIKKYSLYAQLRTMDENPRGFQDHPLKTVREVVFTRIC